MKTTLTVQSKQIQTDKPLDSETERKTPLIQTPDLPTSILEDLALRSSTETTVLRRIMQFPLPH